MPQKKPIPIKVNRPEACLKDFFDMVAPPAVKFMADHFIFGDTYRCVWAIEYGGGVEHLGRCELNTLVA